MSWRNELNKCLVILSKDALNFYLRYLSKLHILLSIQQFLANWKRYSKIIDDILSFFSDVTKLPVQEMTITEGKWEGGAYGGNCIEFMFGGVELGTVVYINRPLECTDVGLGLERICWVLSKSESIFDVVGPLEYSEFREFEVMDTCRFLTLLLGEGLKPGKKGVGNILRSYVKDNVLDLWRSDLERLISYYYSQWKDFIELPIQKEKILEIVREEINRELNRIKFKMLEKLGRKSVKGLLSWQSEPYDRNAIRLHESGLLTFDEARELYQKFLKLPQRGDRK